MALKGYGASAEICSRCFLTCFILVMSIFRGVNQLENWYYQGLPHWQWLPSSENASLEIRVKSGGYKPQLNTKLPTLCNWRNVSHWALYILAVIRWMLPRMFYKNELRISQCLINRKSVTIIYPGSLCITSVISTILYTHTSQKPLIVSVSWSWICSSQTSPHCCALALCHIYTFTKWLPPWLKGRISCMWIKSVFGKCLHGIWF